MDKKKKSGNQKSKKNAKKLSASDLTTRCPCDCEATSHPLVNNCINCGRIVCVSEGPGLCFFCGHMVCYNNEPMDPIYSISKADDKLYASTENKNILELDAIKTLSLRDKLLEYDKNCASRTSVIDDECDYYQASNTWLSKSQREQWQKLAADSQEQKHKSRLQQKLKVDLTGRVLTEEEDPIELFNKMNAIQLDKNFDFTSSQSHYNYFQSLKGAVYISDKSLPSNVTHKEEDDTHVKRIQDQTSLEMVDQGACLSLHQPYASLLVKGIKRTEGRTWYTYHRGRLWIASASKEPDADNVKAIEEQYQSLHREKIQFPKTYPVKCLIGCVTVTDVLSEEEYNKLHPDEPEDNPFIFVCENFIELPVKYPIQGKHKIYKLDPVIHRAALTCLEKVCLSKEKLINK